MMGYVPTTTLKLRRRSDGYYATKWTDDAGKPHAKTFGKAKRAADNRFAAFRERWRRDPAVRNPDPEGSLTIARAWDKFKAHADAYYRNADGDPTGEANNIADAFRYVTAAHADELAADFGPLALEGVQRAMIADDLAINTINQRTRKIRQVFKWLASRELVPASTWHALQAVPAIKRGRGVEVAGAIKMPKATAPVMPVPEAYIWATCEKLPPTIEAMILFQFWTGARPQDVCGLAPDWLDTTVDPTGKVWIARPARHKTAHHGKIRTILIGPHAREAITPYLADAERTDAPIFTPARAMAERDEAKRKAYAPPEGAEGDYRNWPSYKARQAKRTPGPRAGDRWKPQAYGQAIAKAAKAAQVPHWTPNQLRHNAGTRVRAAGGLDAAQVALGHASADVTQVYAEADIAKAIKLMARVG